METWMPCASSCPLCSCPAQPQALSTLGPSSHSNLPTPLQSHAHSLSGGLTGGPVPLTGLPASSFTNVTSSQGHSFVLSFQLIALLKSLPAPHLAFTACSTSAIHKSHRHSHCIVCSEPRGLHFPPLSFAHVVPATKVPFLPQCQRPQPSLLPPPHTDPLDPLPRSLPPRTHPLTSPVGGGAQCAGARAEG